MLEATAVEPVQASWMAAYHRAERLDRRRRLGQWIMYSSGWSVALFVVGALIGFTLNPALAPGGPPGPNAAAWNSIASWPIYVGACSLVVSLPLSVVGVGVRWFYARRLDALFRLHPVRMLPPCPIPARHERFGDWRASESGPDRLEFRRLAAVRWLVWIALAAGAVLLEWLLHVIVGAALSARWPAMLTFAVFYGGLGAIALHRWRPVVRWSVESDGAVRLTRLLNAWSFRETVVSADATIELRRRDEALFLLADDVSYYVAWVGPGDVGRWRAKRISGWVMAIRSGRSGRSA